eukprot:2222788-Pleurochrysis_carterae.AAC.2
MLSRGVASTEAVVCTTPLREFRRWIASLYGGTDLEEAATAVAALPVRGADSTKPSLCRHSRFAADMDTLRIFLLFAAEG